MPPSFKGSMNLLSVQEAQGRILQMIQRGGEIKVKLEQASNRVLAQDVISPSDFPQFDNSAMDGFAILAADTAGSLPITLTVVLDIPAGTNPSQLGKGIKSGEAARIMTGAPLPPGADAVIPVEETDLKTLETGNPAPDHITIFRTLSPSENIRRKGSDIKSGQKVLAANSRLRPQEIGLLAMLGLGEISVFEIPTIALMSSGDELLPVDIPLSSGKIHDSNTPMLASQMEQAGAKILQLGIAGDDPGSVRELLEKAVDLSVDMIISSAGVSVGAFDFIKDAVTADGSLDFWRVNMRPGKPLAFGQYHGIPFFGLPGNPVSAFVTFEVFVRPAIEKLTGLATHPRQRIKVRLAEDIISDGRESYLRAIVTQDGVARLTGHQGSGNLLSLVDANALLIIPAGVKSRPAGQEVEAWLV
jgi:molybdopterin molybdotransferase